MCYNVKRYHISFVTALIKHDYTNQIKYIIERWNEGKCTI